MGLVHTAHAHNHAQTSGQYDTVYRQKMKLSMVVKKTAQVRFSLSIIYVPRNFEIALRKLESVKLLTNFKIAQPSLRNF